MQIKEYITIDNNELCIDNMKYIFNTLDKDNIIVGVNNKYFKEYLFLKNNFAVISPDNIFVCKGFEYNDYKNIFYLELKKQERLDKLNNLLV